MEHEFKPEEFTETFEIWICTRCGYVDFSKKGEKMQHEPDYTCDEVMVKRVIDA